MEKSRSIAGDLVAAAIGSLNAFLSDADPLREIAHYLLRRRT